LKYTDCVAFNHLPPKYGVLSERAKAVSEKPPYHSQKKNSARFRTPSWFCVLSLAGNLGGVEFLPVVEVG
ncbi:MAG: hypothetical protein MK236_09105, partial [Pedosphaera sp.]|nr:hypothetical protein [Pedosphaera sp.]